MKAIVFDFNGTLYNDTRFHMEAWKNFFHRRGIDYSTEEVRKKFIGPGNIDIFRNNIDPNMPMAKMKLLSEEKEREYRTVASSCKENLALVPGATEMFDFLKVHGIPMTVATASQIENVEFYLHTLGLDRWFTLADIVYDDDTLACKPAPDFYLEAMRRMGSKPEETIVVEDSMTGLISARNAHAGKIVMRDETLPRAVLESQKDIAAIIHDFTEFAILFGNLGLPIKG